MGKLHIISTRLTDNSINSRNNPSRKSKADSVLMRRRFQSLMEMEKSPISCWRPDTTLTFVNQPYCDLLGKPEEEILGRKWVEMMPEEIRQKAKSIYADLSKNPSSHRFEYNIRRKNGKVCHMEWTEHPIRDQKGKLIEFMSIGKDITELRKDKENLAESENRYRQLANSMDEGLIIQNEKGVVTYVNNSFLKITSSQERDLLNVSAKNIRNLDKSLVDMLVEQKKFSRKSRCDFRELSLRKNDKKPSYIHVSTIPLVDERGAFKGGLSSFPIFLIRRRLKSGFGRSMIAYCISDRMLIRTSNR